MHTTTHPLMKDLRDTHTHTYANTDRQSVRFMKLRPPTVCWESGFGQSKEQMVLLLCQTGVAIVAVTLTQTYTNTHICKMYLTFQKTILLKMHHKSWHVVGESGKFVVFLGGGGYTI